MDGSMSDDVLQFRKPDASLRKDREYEPRECRHHNVSIKERPRRLRCSDCKKDIDPFEYILELAEEWERLFPKNEAARNLEAALASVLSAHGTVTIAETGVTARQLTANGAKLESHQSMGAYAWGSGGVVAAVIAAVSKLASDAARWGAREVAYPRFTIEKLRGVKKWRVGVLEQDTWHVLSCETTSISQAYDLAKQEAERLEKPFIIEDRPRKLWR